MKPEALKEHVPGIYRAVGKVPMSSILSMYAAMHVVKAADAVVLIDPCRLPESDLKTLEGLGKPTHVIITCGNHVRHAEFYRERYQVRVMANRKLMSKIGIGVDDFFEEGHQLPGGLTAIDMPGVSTGETILLYGQQGGALIAGDAIFNYATKAEFAPAMKVFNMMGMLPLGLNTEPSFAMENKEEATKSYRKLLNYDFDKIFVSHGSPYLSGAKAKWQEVVATLSK